MELYSARSTDPPAVQNRMLINAHDLEPGRTIEGDVVVIGAGACGITLAQKLARTGSDVVVVEGGGRQYDQQSQELYRGAAEGTCLDAGDEYLSSTRLRYLGGTTNHWAGWCRPLDPLDFERREWLEHSGWPIDHAEFARHFAETEEILETVPFTVPVGDYGAWSLFEQSTLLARTMFHFSPPVRFRLKYGDLLDASDRVRVLLHANVLALRLDAEGRRVVGLEVASEPGRSFNVRGKWVVLAAGGIENARLLLASNDVQGEGVGNARDLVGRFFMDHPHRRLGRLLLWKSPADIRAYRSPKDSSQRRMPTISLSEEYRQRQGLLGATIQILKRQRLDPEDTLVRTISGLDRLAGGDAGSEDGPLEAILNIRAEQSPNPASRVLLDDETDRFGVRRARLDWQLQERDLRTLTETARVVAAEMARTGVGRIRSSIEPGDPWRGTVGGEHHVGTTRMAASPANGVVDPDCRVFGVDNLYVAGSSVFPTAGYANPTFSLVALAVRLAEHLRGRLGSA